MSSHPIFPTSQRQPHSSFLVLSFSTDLRIFKCNVYTLGFLAMKVYYLLLPHYGNQPSSQSTSTHTPTSHPPNHFEWFFIQCLCYYHVNTTYSWAKWYTNDYSSLLENLLFLTPPSMIVLSFSFLYIFNTNYFWKCSTNCLSLLLMG